MDRLGRPRNDTVHAGEEPTRERARNAVELAATIVHTLSSLDLEEIGPYRAEVGLASVTITIDADAPMTADAQ
jgi:hypothetical protein